MATSQLGFRVNLANCTGCKACQIACKDKNDLPLGVNWRRVIEYSGGEWVQENGMWEPREVGSYFVPIACMHCEDAPCVEACPTGGLSKRDDGVVLLDEDRCIGCRYCEWACPYGALHYNGEENRVSKCDLCVDLVDNGEDPACVSGCPYRAIEYGPIEELREKAGDLDDPAPLPSGDLARPAVVFTPHPSTHRADRRTWEIRNLEEV